MTIRIYTILYGHHRTPFSGHSFGLPPPFRYSGKAVKFKRIFKQFQVATAISQGQAPGSCLGCPGMPKIQVFVHQRYGKLSH
eukprot:s94_g45.t1